MKRFVEGEDRRQGVLPEYLDDFVAEENQVRVIEAFVDKLDLRALGFEGVVPEATGRPSYHPATMLKIYVYGYVNQIASSRRLEREAQRNVEMMWLTGRLSPDFKTIADFRKDNARAIGRSKMERAERTSGHALARGASCARQGNACVAGAHVVNRSGTKHHTGPARFGQPIHGQSLLHNQ
jgi:transposase